MIISESYLIDIDNNRDKIDFPPARQYKKPKVRLSRLAQEKMSVPVELDIEINENFILKERFDWNLADQNISPTEYLTIFCDRLGLTEQTRDKLLHQLLTQLIDYIDRNTRIKRRTEEEKEEQLQQEQNKKKFFLFQGQNDGNNIDNNGIEEENKQDNGNKENQDDESNQQEQQQQQQQQQEEQPQEQRRTSRQRRLEELKKSSLQSNIFGQNKGTYYRDKKICKVCEYQNITPINRCKKCKCAFEYLEELNVDEECVKVALQFYSGCITFRPYLIDEFDEKDLDISHFTSAFQLLQAFIERISSMHALLIEEKNMLIDFVKSVYGHFKDGTWKEEEQRLEKLLQEEKDKLKQERKEKQLQQQELLMLKKEQLQRQREQQLQLQRQQRQEQLKLQKQQQQEDSESDSDVSDHGGKKILKKGIKKRGRPPKKEEVEIVLPEVKPNTGYQMSRRGRPKRND